MQTTRSRQRRHGSGVNRPKSYSRSYAYTKPRSGQSKRDGNQNRGRGRGYGGGKPRGGNGNRSNSRGGRKMPTFDPSQFINTNPAAIEEVVFTPQHSFTDFGFDSRVVRNIKEAKLTTPTPIQDKVIPEVLNGHDVVGLAETGTGKTAAFLLPLIHQTLKQYDQQTLILTPTRELALQIEAELRKLANHMKIYSTVCVGGTSAGPQIRGLRRQNHFVIGTPGRVLDLINRKVFRTEKVTAVVLDEADRMLDMGFIHDMRKILEKTPKERNTLLFSATMNKETEALSRDFLREPVTISVKKKDVIDTITQDVVPYTHMSKFETLTKLLADESFTRVIIFGAMKHSVEKLSKELTKHGIKAESIHGNKVHNARQRSLKLFKSGGARVLVATDVAARGIHVDDVSHVINYDLPNTFDDYVHRIGRTGRGTKRGKALTFVHA